MSAEATKPYAEGFHYIVKRNEELVADIVGCKHEDHKKFNGQLNPTILEAAKKAKKIALEHNPQDPYHNTPSPFSPEERLAMQNEAHKNYDDFMQLHADMKRFYRYQSIVQEREPKRSLWDKEQYAAGTEWVILYRTMWANPSPEMLSLETRREWEMTMFYLDHCFLNQYVKGYQIEDDYITIQLDTNTAFHRGEEAPLQQIRRWKKIHDPGHHHYVVKTRNAVFASRALPLIQEATSESRVMIGVGTAHLFGKNGVLNLLRKDLGEEYTIEPKVLKQMTNVDTENKNPSLELSGSPEHPVLEEVDALMQEVEKEEHSEIIPPVLEQENVENIETLENRVSCSCQIQ